MGLLLGLGFSFIIFALLIIMAAMIVSLLYDESPVEMICAYAALLNLVLGALCIAAFVLGMIWCEVLT